MDKKFFGKTLCGNDAHVYTLKNSVCEATFTDYGATVLSWVFDGKDVVGGFDKLETYFTDDSHQGATIGRVANRIANATFTMDGVEYRLPKNNGENCLHGGVGFDFKLWDVVEYDDGHITFSLLSPDGDEGFPGRVEVKVRYTLSADNVWRVDYEAVPDKDTPINMTQHVYFNFKGEAGGTIEDHELEIAAEAMTLVDAGQIPTGEIAKVAGGPFDFRSPMRIGERINEPDEQLEIGKGYDHNWILDEGIMAGGKGGLVRAGSLYCPLNGRSVEVWTTEPCLQVYTANWASYDQKAKGGEHLSFRCGIALETQHAPNSPNRPEWPTTTVKAGEKYSSSTEFRFGVK